MRIQSPKTPHRRKANAFENWASPEIAARYRRLRLDKRVTEVIRTLKRRGMTDWHAEILLRNVASIPQDWRSENESWKQVTQRRTRLANKLRILVKEIVSDPDLSGLGFSIHEVVYGHSCEDLDGAQSLAQILEMVISILEPHDKSLIETSDGTVLSPAEFEQRTRPARKVPLTSYALHSIFELLRTGIAPIAKDRPEPRALNKETEILASVLLEEEIKPGTVTHLRKKQRRRNAREQ